MHSPIWDANLYDTQHHYVADYGMELIQLLHPQSGERILDLGCGTGKLTQAIAQSGAQVIGIDSSAQMIQQAQKTYPSLFFQIEDGHDFHFDTPFDAVFSNAALHWMTQPTRVIACVHAALKSKGRFVLEMGGKNNLQRVLQYIAATAQHFGIEHNTLHNYYPNLGEYATLLEAQGFSVQCAFLFDRPTRLEGEMGLRNWVKMFRGDILKQLSTEKQENFFQYLEKIAKPTLFHDNAWWADYVRLRVVALK